MSTMRIMKASTRPHKAGRSTPDNAQASRTKWWPADQPSARPARQSGSAPAGRAPASSVPQKCEFAKLGGSAHGTPSRRCRTRSGKDPGADHTGKADQRQDSTQAEERCTCCAGSAGARPTTGCALWRAPDCGQLATRVAIHFVAIKIALLGAGQVAICSIANLGVQQRISQVHQQVEQHREHRHQHHQTQHQCVVAVARPFTISLPRPGSGKHRLGHHRGRDG
jgi:hypothetical protein